MNLYMVIILASSLWSAKRKINVTVVLAGFLSSMADAIKIRKLWIRKKLVRFISELKIYSFLKRSRFLQIL